MHGTGSGASGGRRDIFKIEPPPPPVSKIPGSTSGIGVAGGA